MTRVEVAVCPEDGGKLDVIEWVEPSLFDGDRERSCVEWSCRCGWSMVVEVDDVVER